MTTERSFGLVLSWWACVPAFPLLFLQARRVRKHVPRLPEAIGPRSGERRAAPGAGTLRLAIVGESTAVGVGADTLDEALPGHLVRALVRQTGKNITWNVLGGNGSTAKRVLSSLLAEPQARFDLAVVLLGVNDVFRLTPIQAWLSQLRLLAKSLSERGCRNIVFSAVPPVGQFPALPQPLRVMLGVRAALLDHHLARLVRELPGATRCNVTFSTEPRYIATDGVHPSSEGYREWAEQLVVALAAGVTERGLSASENSMSLQS